MTISHNQRMAIRSASARRKYASDAELAEARRDQRQERDRREQAERAARGLKQHHVRPEEPPPAYVLLARAHAQPPATLTAYVFGDPPPGRSALDRKREIGR